MVHDNEDDMFEDGFFEDDDFSDDDQDFEDFLNEVEKEQGLDKMENFDELLKQFFLENGQVNPEGKLIQSIKVEQGADTYTEETWMFGETKVSKVTLDTKRTQEEQDEVEKERYVEYLQSTLEIIKHELQVAVKEEDYTRAAELKKRLQKIEDFIKNS